MSKLCVLLFCVALQAQDRLVVIGPTGKLEDVELDKSLVLDPPTVPGGRRVLRVVFPITVPSPTPRPQWSIGYWSGVGSVVAPISTIDMGVLTHIVHWGAIVNADGTVDLTTERITQDAATVISTARAAGVKVLLGVIQSYWLGNTTALFNAVTNNRAKTINAIMDVVSHYGYDGIDIDWEPFSGGTNGPAMTTLLADLRARLVGKLLMSAATVDSWRWWDAARSSNLDRLNVMTYDMVDNCITATSWHNAALFGPAGDPVWSVDLAVRRFTGNGVPASKLGIGLPFYGWQSNGGTPAVTGPGLKCSTLPTTAQVNYYAINQASGTKRFDTLAQVPYNSGASFWVSYDDASSIAAKVAYAKSKSLGGWIIWNLSTDYFPNAAVKSPLLAAVKGAL